MLTKFLTENGPLGAYFLLMTQLGLVPAPRRRNRLHTNRRAPAADPYAAGAVIIPGVDAERRGRREVMNDARRRVERALAATDAADDLARAAEAVLEAPSDATRLDTLRDALKRYRAIVP